MVPTFNGDPPQPLDPPGFGFSTLLVEKGPAFTPLCWVGHMVLFLFLFFKY